MRKLTRILPLAIALLLASCVKDKPVSSDSGSKPNDTVEDIRDGIDDDLQPYRQDSQPENDTRADEAQADEQEDAARPAPARAQKDQTSPSTETTEPQDDQQTTQTSANAKKMYESEIRLRLEHLDSEARQTRARIDAITARKQEIRRQSVQENPDMQLELVTAFNELIDIKNEQIALAIRLGDKKLEREYHAQLTAIQQEQSKING